MGVGVHTHTHTQTKSSFNSGVENHSVGWDMYPSGIVSTVDWQIVTNVAGLRVKQSYVAILVGLFDPWKWDQ